MSLKNYILNKIPAGDQVLKLSDAEVEASYFEFMQEHLFATPYWFIVIVCAIIWFIGSLPGLKNSDIMRLFKGIAKFACVILVLLYFAVTYWI